MLQSSEEIKERIEDDIKVIRHFKFLDRKIKNKQTCCVFMSTPESQQPKPGWEWYQPTTISGLQSQTTNHQYYSFLAYRVKVDKQAITGR